MGARRSIRSRVGAAGLVVAVAAAWAVVAPLGGPQVAGADPPTTPPPTITVTPSAGLQVGDTVTVAGAGFPGSPGQPITLGLCTEAPVEDLSPSLTIPNYHELCTWPVTAFGQDGAFTVELPVTTARARVVFAASLEGVGWFEAYQRVATAPVEVAPPTADAVDVTLTPPEVDAGGQVRVGAVFVGELPADGTADVAVCGQAALAGPADPAVVAAECGAPASVALDAVGEVVTIVTPDAGEAVWVGDLDGPVPLAGVAPLTVRTGEVTVTPADGLADGQQVQVDVAGLGPNAPTRLGARVCVDAPPVLPPEMPSPGDVSFLDLLPDATLADFWCADPLAGFDVPVSGGQASGTVNVPRTAVVGDGSSATAFDCAEAGLCYLLVLGGAGSDVRGWAAPISFQADPPVLLPQAGGTMEGGGPDEGVVQGQVPVVLTRASAFPVTVRYQTFDWPPLPWAATSGTDYVPTEGTLTFAPGETSKLIGVEVVGDAVPEPGEMVLVGLSDASGATIGGYGGIGGLLIGDDD